MKRIVHFITALLIVPNTASARMIQGSVFSLAKKQNEAHFIVIPRSLNDTCSVSEQNEYEVVRVAGGYYVERTHAVVRASRIA